MSNVKVAVRVRPFLPREVEANSTNIIKMQGATTIITNPQTKEEKSFTFDFSYWSCDKNDSHYATQQRLFLDLGVDVLKNAFEGYNASIFAYGQTGSGKSYSMLGYGNDVGIIPLICEDLFKRIENNKDINVSYKVEVSFMEIYNEQPRDLLVPQTQQINLKVRNHPTTGPYVENLTKCAVSTFTEVNELMDEGTKSRTVAATNMNATSSRSHAIFTIVFTQTKRDPITKVENDLVSKINLVDLAGSERAKKTGAKGDTLKEGANINKSLSTLGLVINALAEKSNPENVNKNIFVPYRDSVLTWLLKESLGGNAKTIMIAALSPADINFEETLSTLRYADRAKAIKNNAVVNEDPNAILIKQLREEIEKLKIMLRNGGTLPKEEEGNENIISENQTDMLMLKEKLQQTEELFDHFKLEQNLSWEQKLNATKELMQRTKLENSKLNIGLTGKIQFKRIPAIVNLHQDPLHSECLVYYFPEGITRIGRMDAPVQQNHLLTGIGIEKQHCLIENKDNILYFTPLEGNCYSNGDLVSGPTEIHHNFRIILGINHVFRVHNPFEEDESSNDTFSPDYHFAVKEFTNQQNSSLVEALTSSQETYTQAENIIDDMLVKLNIDKKESKKLLKEKKQNLEIKLEEIKNLEVSESEKEKLKEEAENEFDLQKKKLQSREEKLNHVFELKKEKFLIAQEKKFKEKINLQQKEEELISTVMLINEANNLAMALDKPTKFQIKIRPVLPDPEDIESNEFVQDTEVIIEAIDEKEGNTAFFSQGEFLDRLEKMRELYEELEKNLAVVKDNNSSESKLEIISKNEINDPFSIQKQNVLLGVGHVYLKHLYYLTPLVWNVQIVSHIGQNLAQISIEIEPISKFEASFENEKDWEEFLVGKTLQFSTKIIQISNLSITDYSFLYCTYSLFNQQNIKTEIVDEPTDKSSNSVTINHTKLITFDNVNQELLDYFKHKFMPIEVWVHSYKQKKFIQNDVNPKNEGPQFFDFDLKIEFCESESNDSFQVVPIKIEPWNNPSVVFRLREEKNRTINIQVLEASDTNLFIENWESISLSGVKVSGKFTNEDSITKDILLSLQILEPKKNSVVVKWPTEEEVNMSELTKLTKGRVVVTLVIVLKLNKLKTPITISKDVCFRIYNKNANFDKKMEINSQLLQQFKNDLVDEEEEHSSQFVHVSLKNIVDTHSETIAIIENHKGQAMQLGNTLQAEKLRQELDLQEQLTKNNTPLKMQDPKNSKLMKKKSKLQLEIFEKSLKTNALDINQNSPRQRKISITVEDIKSRQRKGRQGYLNKKGKDKEWKRRYFSTKKPYLYYYNRKEDLINGIRENGAIDLTKSVITLNKPDPKNPFTFGIITKQKIWVLQANSEKEMFAWIEELDPNQSSKKASIVSPIKTMDVEVKKISGSMPKLDLSNLSYSIDNNSIDGNESKDMNLSDIENISNINLSDTSHDISSNDIHEISNNNIGNNTNIDLNNSKSEINILNNYLDENLNVGIEKSNEKEEVDSSEAPLLDKKDFQHDQKLLELVNKVNQLHSKLKLAKSNLRDKDQHVESLQKQLLSARKSFEEIPKQYEEQLGLMTENLRIIKEDTKKENSLIVELFQKDSKTPVPKYNKQGYLDLVKQLENSREVSRAHISHNRYLSQEIDRVEHEHKITINRYKQILESCGIEIDLLTKENQRLQIAQKYYTAKFDLDAPEVEEMDQQIINAQQYQMMKEDFDWLKKSYFVSYALGVKMSIQMALNKNVNFNVHELFDEAMEKGIPVKDWSQWITRRLMDS